MCHIMSRVKLIPTLDLDVGISRCINKSEILLQAARKLYKCQYRDQAVILYYYAVEEFGKAVMLKQKKNDAILLNQKDVDVSDFFYNHDKKIEAARIEIGKDIDILEYNPIPDDGQFHDLVERGPVIRDFFERSSVFLTDYDPISRTWGKDLPIPLVLQIEKAFEQLQTALNKWK